MAINHADGTLFISVPIYSVVGSCAAFSAGALWSLPLFVVAGLAIGICVAAASRYVLYRGLKSIIDSQLIRNEGWWPELILGPLLMLVYFAFPYAVTVLGFFGTYVFCLWIASGLR